MRSAPRRSRQARTLVTTVALLGAAAAPAGCRTGEGASTGGSAVSSGASASQATGRLEERYDPRNDTTLVRLLPPSPLSGLHLLAGAVFEGRQLDKLPEQLLLGVSWTGPAARFQGCERLRWRADGETVAEVEVTRDVQLGGGVTEFLSGTVAFPRGQAMAAAARLSVNICGEELDISAGELELFRRLVRRVHPGP